MFKSRNVCLIISVALAISVSHLYDLQFLRCIERCKWC
jgi:hypothetical protein